MPESVKRRGSSGPTIGAIVRCSRAVAMCWRLLRGARRAADRRAVEGAVGELEQLQSGDVEHAAERRWGDPPPPVGVALGAPEGRGDAGAVAAANRHVV